VPSNPPLVTPDNTTLSPHSSYHHSPLLYFQAAANALKDSDLSQNSASSGSSEGLHEDVDGSNDDDVPAKDFAICALDVLSGTYAAVRFFVW
jgi:phospholipase C